MNQEKIILKNLIENEEYTRKVLPFVKPEYFSNPSEKIIFTEIHKFIDKYNKIPSYEAIGINTDALVGISENVIKGVHSFIDEAKSVKEKSEEKWLLDITEKFCQDKALYNAVTHAIQIMDDKNPKKNGLSRGSIPKILQDALGVTFDTNIGHDYIENSDDRYNYYHKVEKRIPFDLQLFNEITKGGLPGKTLNIFMAGVGVGKSLTMCHLAGACLSQGLDVLYITLEMAEEEIAMRIDANLLNVTLDDLEKIPKDIYKSKIEKLKANTKGKLIVKEYPSTGASVIHFRALLNELALKKDFRPKIIFVDYINICASARISMGSNGVNSYGYVKSIAEELRGLAQEFNVPLVSATQLTRSGFASSEVEMTDTAESFGLPATADFMVAMMTNEELEKTDQIMIKQLKNRYNAKKKNKKFVIGIDTTKMKLYDAEESAQNNIIKDTAPKAGFVKKPNSGFKGIKV